MTERSSVRQVVRRMSLCILVFILAGFLPHKTTLIPFTPTSVEAQEPKPQINDEAIEIAKTGKLIFPAAYDQDGSALTNPQIADSVSIHRITAEGDARVLDFTMLRLGIEVVPSNFWQNPGGTIVEVRLWNSELDIDHRVRAVADEWGAVEIEVPFNPEQLTGIWMYQATAEGFGETAIRSFQIDQSNIDSEIRYGGVTPQYSIAEDGRLTIEITSQAPINEGLGQVQLELYRIKELDNQGTLGREMYPLVIGEATSEYEGQYQLYLDPGMYQAIAVVKSGVTEFRSTPFSFEMAEYEALKPSLIESQAATEDGQVMVMYRTPDDMLAIRTVDAAWLPTDIDVLEEPLVGIIAQRRSAFEQSQTTYLIKNQRSDNALKAFEYDETNQAYIISFEEGGLAFGTEIEVRGAQSEAVYACEVQLDQTSCRIDDLLTLDKDSKLTVDFEQAQIAEIQLRTTQTLAQRAGDKGFFGDVAQNLLEASTKDQAVAETVVIAEWEIHFKLELKFIEISLWSTVSKCTYDRSLECKTEEKDIGDLTLPRDLINGLQDYLFDKFNVREIEDLLGEDAFLDFGGFEIAIGTGIELTTKIGVCGEDFNREAAEQLVEYTGDKLRDIISVVNQILKKVREYEDNDAGVVIPIPFVTPLAVRLVPAVAMKLTASHSVEELSLTLGFTGEVLFKMQIGITIASWGTYIRAPKAIWNMVMYTILFLDLSEQVISAIDILNAFAEENKKNSDVCDPPPPPPTRNPDDRRDADTGFNSTINEDTTSVDYIQAQINKAEDLGLERAKAYWMLQLRERESRQGFTDVAALTEYQTTIEDQQAYVLERMQGVISGTIPLSPGTTITETLDSLYGEFVDQVHEAPYQQTLNELVSERTFVQRRYAELVTGQELELQQELRQMEQGQGIGIVDAGYAVRAYETLKRYGLEAVFVQITSGSGIVSRSGLASREYSPYEAPPVLIVPSGALYNYQGLDHVRQWFEAYTASGGTLLVMTQAEGADWELLPGGEVQGLGYTEDILCIAQSVEIVNPSGWISGISRNKPDIQLDGSFTAWPNNANIILMRTTGNQMPAMLEYSYGAGSVVATSLYADFSTFNAHTLDDKIFGLGFFNMAYLKATNSVIEQTVAPGQTITLQVSLTNPMAQPINSITFWNNTYYHTDLNKLAIRQRPSAFTDRAFPIDPPLQSGETRTIEVTFPAPDVTGIYRANYVLGSGSAWAYSGIIPGAFYAVRTGNEFVPSVQFDLLKQSGAYAYGETAVMTASVRNLLATEQTLTLKTIAGLPQQSTTFTLAPDATHIVTYTTSIFGQVPVKLALERDGLTVSTQALFLKLRPATLGITTNPEHLLPWTSTAATLTATLADSQAEDLIWRVFDSADQLIFTATNQLNPTGSSIQIIEQTVEFPVRNIGDRFVIEATTSDGLQSISQTLKVVSPVEVVSVQFAAPGLMGESAVVTAYLRTAQSDITGEATVEFVWGNWLETITSSGVINQVLEDGLTVITSTLPITTVLDVAMSHSIVVRGTGIIDGMANPVDLYLEKSITIDPNIAALASFEVADTQDLTIELSANPGQVLPPVTGAYTITFQHSFLTEEHTVVVNPVSSTLTSLLFAFDWPAFKKTGVYNVQIESPNIIGWSDSSSLSVKAPKWIYGNLPDVVQAGQPISITVQHDWELDNSLSGTLSLYNEQNEIVAETIVSQPVPYAQEVQIVFNIPERLSSGAYTLRWQGSDSRELNQLQYNWRFAVLGSIELSTETDNLVYYSGQAITSTSFITSSIPLTNTWLRLETFLHSATQTKTLDVIAGKRFRMDGIGFEADIMYSTNALALSSDDQFMLLGDYTESVAGALVLRYIDLPSQVVETRLFSVTGIPSDTLGMQADGLVLNSANTIAYAFDNRNKVVYKIDLTNSTASIVAGAYGSSGVNDGVGSAAQFDWLKALDISSDQGFLLIADRNKLRKVDLNTNEVTTLRTFTYDEIADTNFEALVVLDTSSVYLATSRRVFQYNLDTNTAEWLAGGSFDNTDGDGVNASFRDIRDIEIDQINQRLLIGERWGLRQMGLATPYTVITLAGEPGIYDLHDGLLDEAAFISIHNLALWDNATKLMILDDDRGTIVRSVDFTTNTITALYGPTIHTNGLSDQLNLTEIWFDIAYSAQRSKIVFAQLGYAASFIRELDLNLQTVESLAGNPYTTTAFIDGTGEQAVVNNIGHMIIDDQAESVVFLDGNLLRELDLQTQAVTTLAGTGTDFNQVEGPGDQVRFIQANSFVLHAADNEIVILNRDYIQTVQRSMPYTVTTIAGGSYTGEFPDGVGQEARFSGLYKSVLIPGSQQILMLDRGMLRTMNMEAPYVVSSKVGVHTGYQCVDGPSSVARLNNPRDLSIDGLGRYAFVLDSCGIRRVDLFDYSIETVATAEEISLQHTPTWDEFPQHLEVNFDGSLAYLSYITAIAQYPIQASSQIIDTRWLAVDGAGSFDVSAVLTDVLGPEVEGHLSIKATLFDREPVEQEREDRFQIASAETHFMVFNNQPVWMYAEQSIYRPDLSITTIDDAVSRIQLQGVVHNLATETATKTLTLQRNGDIIDTLIFANLAPDAVQAWSYTDSLTQSGVVTYMATLESGEVVSTALDVHVPTVNVLVALDDESLMVGESTMLKVELQNADVLPAFVEVTAMGESLWVPLAPGTQQTLTYPISATSIGTWVYPVGLDGDVQASYTPTLEVGEVFIDAEFYWTEVESNTVVAEPYNGVMLLVSSTYTLNTVVMYELQGPQAVLGEQLFMASPSSFGLYFPFPLLDTGTYTFTAQVIAQDSGLVLAQYERSFSVEEPEFVLDLDIQTEINPLTQQALVTLIVSNTAQSNLYVEASIVIEGLIDDRTSIYIPRDEETLFTYVVDLAEFAGEQELDVLIAQSEFLPSGQSRGVLDAVAPNERILAHETFFIQAQPRLAPGIGLVALEPVPATIGSTATLNVLVENTNVAGEAFLTVRAFDQEHQILKAVEGFTSTVIPLTFEVPDTVIAGLYPVAVLLGDQQVRGDLRLNGPDIVLEQFTDAPIYAPHSAATWTVELEGTTSEPRLYDVSLRYHAEAFTQTVTLVQGQVVPVSWTFETGIETEYATVVVLEHQSAPDAAQYQLVIDTIKIEVQSLDTFWLATDKDRYQAGETVALTLDIMEPVRSVLVLSPDHVNPFAQIPIWTSYELSTTARISGTHSFTYTLPTVLPTGRYAFEVLIDNTTYLFPVDVFGVQVVTDMFEVVPVSQQTGSMALDVSMRVRSNELLQDVHALAYVVAPDGTSLDLGSEAFITTTLQADSQMLDIAGVFTPTLPGMYQVGFDILSDDGQVLGGSFSWLELGSAHLVDLTSDHGVYAPGQAGQGSLVVYGSAVAEVAVVATDGTLLLNQTLSLTGYQQLLFALPTTLRQREVLTAVLTDSLGMTDTLSLEYLVADVFDTAGPVVEIDAPIDGAHVVIEPGVRSITVTGSISDASAISLLTVNDLPVEISNGRWEIAVPVELGLNSIDTYSVDEHGNQSLFPNSSVYIEPRLGVDLRVTPLNTQVDDLVLYQSLITSTETITAHLWFPFDSAKFTINDVNAATGVVSTTQGLIWTGQIGPNQPLEVTWDGSFNTEGVYTQTVTLQGPSLVFRKTEPVTLTVTNATAVEYQVYLPRISR